MFYAAASADRRNTIRLNGCSDNKHERVIFIMWKRSLLKRQLGRTSKQKYISFITNSFPFNISCLSFQIPIKYDYNCLVKFSEKERGDNYSSESFIFLSVWTCTQIFGLLAQLNCVIPFLGSEFNIDITIYLNGIVSTYKKITLVSNLKGVIKNS